MTRKKQGAEMPYLGIEMPDLFGEAEPAQRAVARQPKAPKRHISKKVVYYYGPPHRPSVPKKRKAKHKPSVRMDPQLERALQRTRSGVKVLRKEGPKVMAQLGNLFRRKKKSIYK